MKAIYAGVILSVIILTAPITLGREDRDLANSDKDVQDTKEGFFSKITNWFLILLSKLIGSGDNSIEDKRTENVEVKKEAVDEEKIKKPTENKTCTDCRRSSVDWVKQGCFAEDFICPEGVEGTSLDCMPPLINPDYAKFCTDPCRSWIIERCGMEGYIV